jgi:hypothetical protein
MSFEKELEYYKKNKEEFLKRYMDRYLVIVENKLIGDYGSEKEAYDEALKKFDLGSFLIKKCVKDETLQSFHSRVVFP